MRRTKLLKDCQIGQTVRLTVTGGKWKVWARTKGVNTGLEIIQLKHKMGMIRTYTSKDPRWHQRVWPAQSWEK